MNSHRILVTVLLGCVVGMGGCGESNAETGGSGATGGARGPGATGGTGGSGATGGMGGRAGSCNWTDFPNGVAAGDVDQSSVVLWARASFVGTVRFEYGRDPDFVEIDGFRNVPVSDPAIPAKTTGPEHEVTGLLDGTQYYYRACRDSCPSAGAPECETRGRFGTSHTDGLHGLSFGVSSCFRGDMRPFVAIKNVPERDLDLFVALGDTVYADSWEKPVGDDLDCPTNKEAATIDEFRCKHALAYSKFGPSQDTNMFARARASTAFFANIDDHEVDDNFAGGDAPKLSIQPDPHYGFELRRRFCEKIPHPYPPEIDDDNCNRDFVNETDLFLNGLQAFEEYNPIREERYAQSSHDRDQVWAGKRKLYRYRTFGKDAALFNLDTRSFRQRALIAAPYADRTMLGSAQLNDLKSDLRDAETKGITWKFVLVPEPIQNLGIPSAVDRFEGYAHERGVILDFIQSECIANVVFVSGDIHGTIANNLTYKRTKLERPRYSASWDISTGPVAYHPPFGPSIIDKTPGPENTLAKYDLLSREKKDDKIAELMDSFLRKQGYPLTGLDPEHPHGTGLLNLGRLFPSSANMPATLSPERFDAPGSLPGAGDGPTNTYVATNTFGWTEFEIDAAQKLTVTTYGILPYASKTALLPEAVDPSPVSQFEVTPGEAPPGCGCDPSAVCANDAACCPDNVCNGVACVGRNSLHTLAPCTRDDACESGLCSAARVCIFERSLPNYSPCTRDVACQSGVCGLEGGPNAGLCGLPLLALCSTHAQCRAGTCRKAKGVLGNELPNTLFRCRL